MILLMLLALTQAAAASVAAPAPTARAPQKWSILAPPDCPVEGTVKEGDHTIVVCAPGVASSARLPLPDDRGPPDHPVASNPDRSGIGALHVEGTPCAALQGGCGSSFGPPIAPIAKAAIGLVKSALAKKPDKTGRIPIDLDGPVGTVN